MHRYGKFSILGVCLLIFSLVTGSIVPNIKVARALTPCTAPFNPSPISDAVAAPGLNALNNMRQSASVWIATSQGNTISPSTLSLPTVAKDSGQSGIGAQAHAIYLANNPSSFPNAFETSGNACTTTQGDQAAKVAARFTQAPSLASAVTQSIDSIYLRLPLLHPRLAKVGLGLDFDNSNTGKTVIDDSGSLSTDNYVTTNTVPEFNGFIIGYPGNNSTIPTTLPVGEGRIDISSGTLSRLAGGFNSSNIPFGDYPDPITKSVQLINPVGYPINLLFDETLFANKIIVNTTNSSLGLVSGSITNPVGVKLITPDQSDNVYSELRSFGPNSSTTTTPKMQAIIMIPTAPLIPNAQYKVTFAFSLNGTPQTLSWQFNTGTNEATPTVGGTTTPGTPGTATSGSGGGGGGGTPIVIPSSAAKTPTPTQGLPGVVPPPNENGPTAFYTPTPADGQNPPQFFQVWRRVDDPVKFGLTSRSWLYGPLPYGFSILFENYEGGRRIVAYHDKARMEITNPNTGYVSNGLLVKELISGYLQLGDNKYDIRTASFQTVAGDPFELNPTTPTYAAFAKVVSLNNDKRSPDRTNQQVVETMDRNGNVNVNIGTASYGVTYSHYNQNLGHNIPDRFWNFMNQVGLVRDGGYYNDSVFNWVTVMGLPLSEPYWVQATVGGQVKDVLVQVFERRVLTFTPSNSPAFQVEMGNVGRHYYQWRYGTNP